MAKTKRTKPSKKPTTKGKDLPESFQWLLDFVNIGCRPGKLSLTRVFERPKVKRPPAEPGTIKEVTFDGRAAAKFINLDKAKRKEYIENIENENVLNLERSDCEFFDLIINPDSPYNNFKNNIKYLNPDFLVMVDENGNVWNKTPKGELIFRGNRDEDPSREELRDFLSKTGISEDRNMKAWEIEGILTLAIYSLIIKMKPIEEIEHLSKMEPFEEAEHLENYVKQGHVQLFIYDHYNKKQIQLPDIRVDGDNSLINGLKYSHDNTLSQATCAYILDFWHNHRELHQHLRQCKCCGKFWIEAKPRKKFCCKKCEVRFNQASRQAVRESLRKQRKKLSKDKKEIAHNEIINWLRNGLDFKSKDAEKEYEGEKWRNSNNVNSLSNFKRTYGKRNGLI